MERKMSKTSTNAKENGKLSDVKDKLNYRDTLDTITKARYVDKLKGVDGKDPYELDKTEWSTDLAEWPEVTYPDIVNYLVYTQSSYTLAELKAYKSLQAYNYFVSGFVQDIGHKVVNGKSMFLGKVKHSQRMSDPSLKPWLIVEGDGTVSTAHCNCMAGIGEVCSHVGALLFAIEAAIKIRNSKTVTDEKAYWMFPNVVNKVEFKSVRNIDFTSAKTKKKKLDDAIAESSEIIDGPRQRKLPTVQEPNEEELALFYSDLSRTGTKPVLLSLVPQFAKSYRPKALDNKYPYVLSELYSEDAGALHRQELLKKCEDVFETIKVTAEEAMNCEKVTREQAKSKQWFNFRVGRLTASRVRQVCRSSPENPSKSLIKEICYPNSKAFTAKQTQWGCDHEKTAKVQYIKKMSGEHTNFQWHDTGLIINPTYPFMGATPDGKATCDCCEDMLIEIKCPYCQRNDEISGSVDCLKDVNGQLHLNKDHSYYYQVQCQLLMAEIKSCDFIVWTSKDFFIEKIPFDETFCQDMVDRCKLFFKKAVLPELVGKLYSRPLQEQPVQQNSASSSSTVTVQADVHTSNQDKLIICVCRTVYNEDTDNVIGCDNENCPYVWLHFKCAGIRRVPKGKWICKSCRK